MKLFGWTISRDVQDSIRIVRDLQRVSLADGDLLVVRIPGHISVEAATRLREHLESLSPLKEHNIKTLVLSENMTVGVLGMEKPKAP